MMESVNAVLKDIRSLPITSLIQATFVRVVEIFNQQRARLETYTARGLQYTKFAMDLMERGKSKSPTHVVTLYDNRAQIYSVVTAEHRRRRKGGNVHTVNLVERTCDCGKFQQRRIPCSHAIACLQKLDLNPDTHIDPYYSMEVANQIYEGAFYPVRHEEYWPAVDDIKWAPNPALKRQKGRPRSTRIKNSMDWREHSSQTSACKKCQQPGHNSRTCTNVPRTVGESSSNSNKCKKCKQRGHNSRTCKNVPSG